MTGSGIAVSALILSGAMLIVKGYKRFCRERAELGQAFLEFIKFRGERIARFSSPKSEICGKFESGILEDSGFLPSLRSGMSYLDSFISAKEKLPLSASAKGVLEASFRGMGSGYLSEEREKQRAMEAELSRLFAKEREELERDARVKSTLILSAALGAVSLLL